MTGCQGAYRVVGMITTITYLFHSPLLWVFLVLAVAGCGLAWRFDR